MIDEFSLKALDWTIEHVSKWFAPWKVRLKRSFLGFRPSLIAQRAKHNVLVMRSKISEATEEGGFFTRWMTEPMETVEKTNFFAWLDGVLMRADAALAGREFAFHLFLMLLGVLLLAGRGGGEMAMLCALFCLQWLSEGMETDYAPVSSGVHQKYVAAMALRACSYLAAAVCYFAAYAQRGLQINIILQGSMGLAIAIHVIFFVGFVAFNQRQQPFLRALSGVLGLLPALMGACAAALGAATAAMALPVAIGGIVRAVGAALVFLSETTRMVSSLGGNRLRFGRLWQRLLGFMGFFMMLLAAWLCVL